jgi:flagellar biosynthetic protein FliR
VLAALLPSVSTDQALSAFAQASHSATPELALAAGLVVFARIIGFFIMVPFFGSMNIPMVARLALALTITVIITPIVMGPATAGLTAAGLSFQLLLLLVNQLLIGLMLGLACAFTMYGIESAGRVIDSQRGSGIADLASPMSGDRSSALGQWLQMTAVVIMLLTGLHLVLLQGIIQSFHMIPATASLDWIGNPTIKGDDKVIRMFADMSGHMLVIMIKIAAPAMLSLLLADVLLGIINRGAPQVNVFSLSQVIKGPLGHAAMLVAMLQIVTYIDQGAFKDLLGMAQYTGNGIPHSGDLYQLMRRMGA